MAIRNVYYTEVIINGETSESLGPSADLTDKEIVSAGTRKAREVIKTLDKKSNQQCHGTLMQRECIKRGYLYYRSRKIPLQARR